MIETERLTIQRITTEEEFSALLAIYNKAENMKYIQSGKYHEVVARMYEENTGSIRICEKIGFHLQAKGETADGKKFREYSKF